MRLLCLQLVTLEIFIRSASNLAGIIAILLVTSSRNLFGTTLENKVAPSSECRTSVIDFLQQLLHACLNPILPGELSQQASWDPFFLIKTLIKKILISARSSLLISPMLKNKTTKNLVS